MGLFVINKKNAPYNMTSGFATCDSQNAYFTPDASTSVFISIYGSAQ